MQYLIIAFVSATEAKTPRTGTVLLIDVAGSSGVANFAAVRDRQIEKLSRNHLSKKWINASYTVTAWDEFQTLLFDWRHLPHVLLDIRRILAPQEAYIGVGTGHVSGWRSKKPINRALSGEAFERARRAMDELKRAKGDKYRRLTHFSSGAENRDALLNLIYGLNDTLVQQITERQWETINAALEHGNQEEVAKKLAIQPSTVTRNLRRGHYWQIRETIEVVSMLLGAELPA